MRDKGTGQIQVKYNRRLARIMDAVALKTPDRTPVVLEYSSFAALVTGTPFPEFLLDLKRSVEVMIQAFELATAQNSADAINYGRFSPYALAYAWLSKVRVPGVDLPPEASYQVVEKEVMTESDYDRILEEGWPAFRNRILAEKIFNDLPPRYLPANQPPVDIVGPWAAKGIPVLKGGTVAPPFEFLSGGRGLTGISFDMFRQPDKVAAAMDEIVGHQINEAAPINKSGGYPVIWVGGWRSAPEMMSPKMWDRFIWPYLRRLILEVIEAGYIPLLHLDSNWDRELARFRELPAKRMIMALDGASDIRRAREVLGGHTCLMGDVPAALLFNGSPDEVYNYSAALVRDLGPEGFILASGCDIPENAKLENVAAMIAAAHD